MTRNHFQGQKVKVTRPLWLVVLAGQHGHTVMVTFLYVYNMPYMTYIVSPPADLVGAYHGGRQTTACLISEFPQQRKTMLEVTDNVNFKLIYILQRKIIFFILISLSIYYDCIHYFHHILQTSCNQAMIRTVNSSSLACIP